MKKVEFAGKNMLKCSLCNSNDITSNIGYYGLDEYKYSLTVTCEDCGRTMELAKMKNETDVIARHSLKK